MPENTANLKTLREVAEAAYVLTTSFDGATLGLERLEKRFREGDPGFRSTVERKRGAAPATGAKK